MAARHRSELFKNIEVTGTAAKGKSVAKAPDGRVVFVSNAVPGDVIDVRTHKKRKNYYEGTAISFHTFSDKRTEPICKHFGLCGGCKWQHMAYEHQLRYKQQEVEDHLTRIGKLTLPSPEARPSILGSEKTFHYRNKMEFSFSNNRWLTEEEIASGGALGDRNALGLHIPGKWDKILDIEECHLMPEPANTMRLTIKKFAVENGLTFYDTRKPSGMLRSMMLRHTSTGEWMVLLQLYEDHPEKRTLLLDHIAEKFPEVTSLLYTINRKGNDTLYDLDITCHKGRAYITEEMEGLQFRVYTKSFYQTNSAQAYELYKVARGFAGLTGEELVYDLYSGAGTIALFLAKHAKKVVGIESVPDAVKAAEENAALNEVKNAVFHAGDMKDLLSEAFISANGRPDIVIIDPPRDGMHKKVVAQLLETAPKRIVYISCNSATQARDLEMLKGRYALSRSRAVDMFPQTHHVENIVLLELR